MEPESRRLLFPKKSPDIPPSLCLSLSICLSVSEAPPGPPQPPVSVCTVRVSVRPCSPVGLYFPELRPSHSELIQSQAHIYRFSFLRGRISTVPDVQHMKAVSSTLLSFVIAFDEGR